MKNNNKKNELTKWSIKNGRLYSKDIGYIDNPSVLIRVDTGQLLEVGNYDTLQALNKWTGAINGWNMRVERVIGKTPAETLAYIQQMAKVRWYIHSVFQTPDLPEYIQNNHTHGMQEEYEHYDFQMLINLGANEISRLLNTISFRVQEGEIFKNGQMVSGLYEDCNIRLDLFRETGRDVLRLIIPDKDNRFPEDPLCKKPYKYQTMRLFED